MIDESGSESEDIDNSTWQMLSQVETSPFQDFDAQDLTCRGQDGATSFLSAHSKGGILKHKQLLTEKELKQVYKGRDPKKGVKINVTEITEDEKHTKKV